MRNSTINSYKYNYIYNVAGFSNEDYVGEGGYYFPVALMSSMKGSGIELVK